MKFLPSVLSTAMLAFAAGIFLPWWGIAFAGLISGAWLLQKPGVAFLSGFLSVFLLWAGFALVRSQMNDDILATRFARLILKADQPLLLVLLTGVIGGLVAGLGALSGSLGRIAFSRQETKQDESSQIPEETTTEQAD
jgi:hypothetical protein